MALTKVGVTNTPVQGAISNGQTFDIEFAADTTFQENDFLYVAFGAGQDVTGGNPGITLPAGWGGDEAGHYWAVGYTNHPYIFQAYHFVTAGEAGSATITCTVTVDDIGGVGAYYVPCGIAVRGGDSINSQAAAWAEEEAGASGTTSPQTLSLVGSTGYPVGTAGTLVFYVATTGGGTTDLSGSYAWSNADVHELDDRAVNNYFGGTRDMHFSVAYALVTDDVIPATDVTRTFSPNGTSFKAAWTFITLDGTPPTPTLGARYEITTRRVNAKQLPYEVTRRMLERELD